MLNQPCPATPNAIIDQLAAEKNSPKRLYWLSFADETGNLGVAIVRSYGILNAVAKATKWNANPGGEVLCALLPEEITVDKANANRLLTPGEANAMLAKLGLDG